MPEYRRWYQPGGTFFFTVVTYERWPLFQNPSARSLLGSVMRSVSQESPVQTLAIVLLWDHLHCVWVLPHGDLDFSGRWQAIKSRFSTAWVEHGGSERQVTPSQKARGHRGLWQRRFWEHQVRDEGDLEHCCDYIHYNPVKHGYVSRPWDWPWSSFRRFVKEGHYPQDWGRSLPTNYRDLDWE
jgi:putative transposase